MNLIQRITDILLKPKDTWPVIAQEPGDVASIYSHYLVFLAAIPALASFVGYSLVGTSMFGVSFRLPLMTGLVNMVVGYVLALAMVYLLALIVDALAPTFGGSKSLVSALKLVAYGATAGFVGGIFSLMPALSMLGLLAAFYSVYLIYTGLPVLMKCPPDKAVAYTAVVVVCGIAAGVILAAVSAMFMHSPGMHMGGMPGGSVSIQTPGGEVKFDTNKMNEAAKKMEEASQRMQQAQTSGDSAAAGKAMGDLMGAMAGATGGGAPLPAQDLKALLPAMLGGLPRQSIEAQSGQAVGLAGSSASAQYAAGGQRIDLSITDLGGLGGLAAMAGWAQTTLDRETPEKTEKVYKQGNRTIHEEFRKDNRRGELGVFLANGVMVEIKGQGVDAATLKSALETVNLNQIEAMQRPTKQ